MMQRMPIGIGVVGLGFMGRAYAQICTQLADARVVGVADVAAAGQAVAERYHVPFYHDAADLVARPEVEAIIVATPEDAHVEPCCAALAVNKSVLVEKPIADTSAAAQQIIAAQQPGTVLLVGHVLRFAMHYVLCKQAVDQGQLGAVQHIFTRRLNGKSAQDRLSTTAALSRI